MTPCEGKKEALLIDMTQNSDKHLRRTAVGYDLDAPVIKSVVSAKKKQEEEDEDGDQPKKTCPGISVNNYSCPFCSGILSSAQAVSIKQAFMNGRSAKCHHCSSILLESDNIMPVNRKKTVKCGAQLDLRARKCRLCGYEFGATAVDFDMNSLEEVYFGKVAKKGSGGGMKAPNADMYEVSATTVFSGKKEGCIGVSFKAINVESGLKTTINDFILLPPWYKGGQASLALKKWKAFIGGQQGPGGEEITPCQDHKMNFWIARKKFRMPKSLEALQDGKFWRIKRMFF